MNCVNASALRCKQKNEKSCCPQQVVFHQAVVYKCKLVDYSKVAVYKCKQQFTSVNQQFTLVKYLIPGLQLFFS